VTKLAVRFELETRDADATLILNGKDVEAGVDGLGATPTRLPHSR